MLIPLFTRNRDVFPPLSVFPYSLKNPLISLDLIRGCRQPVPILSTSKLTVSSGRVPRTLFACFCRLERLHASRCSSPARVGLLYTCLHGLFFFPSCPKTLNTESLPFSIFVSIRLVSWCPAITSTPNLTPSTFCCILPDCCSFIFPALTVCV